MGLFGGIRLLSIFYKNTKVKLHNNKRENLERKNEQYQILNKQMNFRDANAITCVLVIVSLALNIFYFLNLILG